MKKIIKTKNIVKIIIIFLILLNISIINASSFYEKLDKLKGNNCYLADIDSVSGKDALINKFGLNDLYDEANKSCIFIIDFYSNGYAPITSELAFFPFPWHGEINYVVDTNMSGNKTQYLLLLGNTTSGVEDTVSLVTNYTNYQFTLNSFSDIFAFDELPEMDQISNENCQDKSFENIYIGNNGSYWNGSETVYFNSYCFNNSITIYPYCSEGEDYKVFVMKGQCVKGRYLADTSLIFYYLRNFGDYFAPRQREINSKFLRSAINNWINNGILEQDSTTQIGATSFSREEATTTTTKESLSSGTSISVSNEQFNQGYNKEISEKDNFEIIIENEPHYITVISIEKTKTTIEVKSKIQTETLSIGDEKKFEITEDNYYDIYVKLNNIKNNKSNLTIKSIHEKISQVECTSNWDCTKWSDCINRIKTRTCTDLNNCGKEKPLESKTCSTPSKKITWILLPISIVFIIIIILIIYFKKKKF